MARSGGVGAELRLAPAVLGSLHDGLHHCAKLGLDRGLAGALYEPSSYFMKTPPEQYSDDIAHEKTETFIQGKKAAS